MGDGRYELVKQILRVYYIVNLALLFLQLILRSNEMKVENSLIEKSITNIHSID